MAEEKELKIELEQSNKDINKNVGSFSTNVVPAITDVSDGSESKKIPEQEIQKAEEKDPLINFDRFTKTKKKRAVKQATTQFGVKVELWLGSKKTLCAIWGIIFAVIAFLWAFQIFYVVNGHHILKSTSTWLAYSNHKAVLVTGVVFSYISIILPLLPLLFLVTSWFVGINGVHASKIFHYIFWSVLLVCLCLFVVSSVCCWVEMSNYWSFNGYTPPSS